MSINKLPENMLVKVQATECPVPGLEGMCWTWTGCLNSKNYGCVGFDKKVRLTHRVSYELHKGPIPEGLQIDHLCRNTRCCNPHHLEAVTGKVNSERSVTARKTHCKQLHALAGPNLKIKNKPRGGSQRQCVVCEMDAGRRRTDKANKGVRKPSTAWTESREAKREWLIAAGEAALAGLPIPPEPSPRHKAEVVSLDDIRDAMELLGSLILPDLGHREATPGEAS